MILLPVLACLGAFDCFGFNGGGFGYQECCCLWEAPYGLPSAVCPSDRGQVESGWPVCFVWVKAHMGIQVLNESADAMAKEGYLTGGTPDYGGGSACPWERIEGSGESCTRIQWGTVTRWGRHAVSRYT